MHLAKAATILSLTACIGLAAQATAQSIAQQIAKSDGVVELIYPSRPTVCGDGEGMIANLFGRSKFISGSSTFSGHGSRPSRPCEHGPARIEVSVSSGEVTRLRTYVGPLRARGANSTSINASTADAAAWLSELVSTANGRVPADAMLPLLLADTAEPWPLLLTVARDQNRSRSTRSTAMMWLGNGITDKLGLGDDSGAQDDEDEMRQEAVFVLSQRPKSESVPDLIDLAKNGKYPSVRRSAVFWLGQSGDPRAADTYAELLESP